MRVSFQKNSAHSKETEMAETTGLSNGTAPTAASSLTTGSYAESGNSDADLEELEALDDQIDNDNADHIGQHPRLNTVCVMNCDRQCRIVPNGPAADISNDTFEGKVMLLMRTPDVDGGDQTGMDEFPKQVSNYFKGKKRRFEFQFQIKLKRIPQGPLFLGCELEHAIKVGALTKGLVGILLAMVRRINPGFHYSWGPDAKLDAKAREDGNFEQTHLSFPVEASMDRIVITKPGEAPPELGTELYESNESVKRRRKLGAGSVQWNLEDTFTMCLWSAYADWIDWRSLNVPGMAPFSLTRVTGTQPIYLCVYEITNCTPQEYRKKRGLPHTRKDLSIFVRLEFSNQEHTNGGLAESVLGRKSINRVLGSEQSLPDTESVDSDFETGSTISRVTMG